jgi:hypothetical protein
MSALGVPSSQKSDGASGERRVAVKRHCGTLAQGSLSATIDARNDQYGSAIDDVFVINLADAPAIGASEG